MEWVETTGRTVDEAKETALDELGVDEADAEFQVIAEAQTGLFGRLRSEARVRARVRPTAPRPKDDHRDRRRRNKSNQAAKKDSANPTDDPGNVQASPAPTATATSLAAPEGVGAPASDGAAPASSNGRSPERRRSGSDGDDDAAADKNPPKSNGAEVEVSLDEQAQIAEDFLAELTTHFGLSATVSVVRPDEETAELQLSGSDLGLLIGPKGNTLVAIQNLTRTVVFHQTGATNGHVNVDVGGYRHKRSEALARFAKQIASTVQETGRRTALEPMPAVDRKVVHDAISEIDGVSTISEGEEPRRRVVVLPNPA